MGGASQGGGVAEVGGGMEVVQHVGGAGQEHLGQLLQQVLVAAYPGQGDLPVEDGLRRCGFRHGGLRFCRRSIRFDCDSSRSAGAEASVRLPVPSGAALLHAGRRPRHATPFPNSPFVRSRAVGEDPHQENNRAAPALQDIASR